MFRITLRSLWDHKRRLISTLVAIVLGVAFMAGTFVLSDTMDQTFDDLFAESFAKVDAEVQGKVLFDNPFGGGDARAAFGEDVLDDVRAVDGVATGRAVRHRRGVRRRQPGARQGGRADRLHARPADAHRELVRQRRAVALRAEGRPRP